MVVSILHRATGVALTIAGLGLLTWWLFALSGSAADHEAFVGFLGWQAGPVPIVLVVLIGLSWAFFQHTLSGIRHLIMDSGAGFELRINKTMAYLTLLLSALLTAGFWMLLLEKLA